MQGNLIGAELFSKGLAGRCSQSMALPSTPANCTLNASVVCSLNPSLKIIVVIPVIRSVNSQN